MNKIVSLFKRAVDSLTFKYITAVALIVILNVSVIGIITYRHFSKKVIAEIELFNSQILKQLRDTVDDVFFKRARLIAVDMLFKNTTNEALHYFLDHPTSGNYDVILDVQERLKYKNVANNDIIESIAVFYKNNNMIISSISGVLFLDEPRPQPFFDTKWIKPYNTIESKCSHLWLNTRESVKYESTDPVSYIITLIRTLPMESNTGNYQGLLAINIKEHALYEMIQSFVPKQSRYVLILNDSGDIVTQDRSGISRYTDNYALPVEKILDFGEGTNLMYINNTETVVTVMKSRYTDWYLTYIVQADQYYRGKTITGQFILAVFSVSSLLALILISAFSYRFINPFARIATHSIELLRKFPKLSKKKNVIEIIESTIDTFYHRAENLEQILERNKKVIARSLYFDLLHGRIQRQDEVEQRLNFLEYKAVFAGFSVFVLQFNRDLVANMSSSSVDLINYSLVEKIEDSQSSLVAIVEDLYHIAFIFNHEPDDLETVKKMVSFLNNIVLMNYSIPCQIGIGTPKKNIMLINKSFQEASNVLKYAELYPKKKYFYFRDTSLLDFRSIKFEKINNIKDYINLCDVSSFADLLNNINNHIQKREISYESYKEIIETIVFLFERTLKEIGFAEKTILKKSIREIINENYYVNDVFQAFKDIMRIIVEYQKDLNTHKGREYINKAKEFIAENLDKDISLDMIAEELNLSSSYISKLFKDITNVKFLSYVTRLRMEKAKELLTEGGMLVHTVAGKVGFHNYSYFSKMFKKYYGQLPGVYRRKR